MHNPVGLIVTFAMMLAMALAGKAQASGPDPSFASSAATSSFTAVTITAPALAGNIIGEPAQRELWVYLPAAYFTADTALPVIYFLPGFGTDAITGVEVQADFDNSFKTLQPAIVVIISGVNRYRGSFFVDSAVTGNWAEFMFNDVVNYVDANYRTLAKPEARGIAGHSMGGFGALNLAMRHADIFGSVFAMAPGLVDSSGMLDTQIFDTQAHIKRFIASLSGIKQMPAQEALASLSNNRSAFDIAYGMAFAPILTPPYFEYPYTVVNNTLVVDETIMAKWNAGFGDVQRKIIEFKPQLKSLNGIGLDCGINDEFQWIVRGCEHFHRELTAAGIEHVYTTHRGRHMNQLPARTLEVMLPFFSQRLATQ
ncbi:alpha/beta hydrolase family protein [Rheinheimera sp.]|uniref:alpha/beta hydrolase n=1 Tax=Rheinheimera sp. TaxID=1869214 RepID=UPI0027363098|nr:alpha/beta hydrolase-fold protein [Rheinheimera sp.]MDP2713764.1 alpha/beta hydrolase-fold protein [Rheinheimera sp.]